MHWIQQYQVDGHLSECYVSGVKGGEDTLEGTEVSLRSGKWRKRTETSPAFWTGRRQVSGCKEKRRWGQIEFFPCKMAENSLCSISNGKDPIKEVNKKKEKENGLSTLQGSWEGSKGGSRHRWRWSWHSFLQHSIKNLDLNIIKYSKI